MFRGSPSVLPSFYRVFPVDRIDLASFHRLALLWPYVYLVLPSFARLKNNDNNKNDTVYRRRYGASVDHFIIAERAVRGQASTFNDRQRRDAPAHRLGDVDSSSRRLFCFPFCFPSRWVYFFWGGEGELLFASAGDVTRDVFSVETSRRCCRPLGGFPYRRIAIEVEELGRRDRLPSEKWVDVFHLVVPSFTGFFFFFSSNEFYGRRCRRRRRCESFVRIVKSWRSTPVNRAKVVEKASPWRVSFEKYDQPRPLYDSFQSTLLKPNKTP